jgi:hypothetical protein
MSKIGRVVQEIMERFDGNIPEGYTLEDHFRDKAHEERLLQSQRAQASATTNQMDVISQDGQEL